MTVVSLIIFFMLASIVCSAMCGLCVREAVMHSTKREPYVCAGVYGALSILCIALAVTCFILS